MGTGMTNNLIKKGGPELTVWGYDPVEEARERLRKNGGKPTEDKNELYRSCEAIFFCLPTNDLVRATVLEITEIAKPGTTIVDMGASSPYLIQELHGIVRERGFDLLDAPVSGGKTGADDGTLAIMCGGEKEVFDRVKPWLEMMGSTVTYMGPSGCGSMSKVANNMMVGIHLAAMGEAYALAVKAGLDPHTLFEAIRGGFAQSAVMDLKIPKVLARDFEATARIAVHYKDIHNAMDMSEKLGIDLPLTKIVEQQMDWINEHGLINEDQAAMVKYYEDSMGVVIG
jgi:2-hydroxy-3-oxopropionate reductase